MSTHSTNIHDANEYRQCTATAKIHGKRCGRQACKGSHVCDLHGGNTPLARAAAKQRLLMMVEPAFEMLVKAMESDDIRSGVKAAEIILDRAGFGPKSTVMVEDNRDNLANLTREELAQRAASLAERARSQVPAPVIEEGETDSTPTNVH